MARGIHMKGRKLSEETKRKIGLAHLGMKRTGQTRENISKALTGKKFTPEHIENCRKGHMGLKWGHHTLETKLKMRIAALGKPKSAAHCKAIGLAKLGSKGYWTGKKRPDMSGENNWKWITDRTKLKDDHKDRGGQLHREWSRSVKNRDGWKCKISNGNCSGRVEAHHILGWKPHPELRYQTNNGITLCHYHHPRKREDERRLSPYFQSLVETVN